MFQKEKYFQGNLLRLVEEKRYVPYPLQRWNRTYEEAATYWCAEKDQAFVVHKRRDGRIDVLWQDETEEVWSVKKYPFKKMVQYILKPFEFFESDEYKRSLLDGMREQPERVTRWLFSVTGAEVLALCCCGNIDWYTASDYEAMGYFDGEMKLKDYVYYECYESERNRPGKVKRDTDKSPRKARKTDE